MKKYEVEIESSHGLYAEDVEWCTAELCKAVGAHVGDATREGDGEYGDEWDGKYGDVWYSTDEHRYHLIHVTVYDCGADEGADWLAITQIAASMSAKGCTVLCYDRDNQAHENYLQRLHDKIQQF